MTGSYCANKSKATVTLTNVKSTIKVIVQPTPAIVECNTVFTIYSHDTKSPINQSFNKPIISVELSPPGQTYNNGAPNNPIRLCPLPSISGDKIISDFDNYYPDNVGICSYKVFFAGINIKNGNDQVVFQSSEYPCEYTVACDDECPPGYLKLDSPNYPGYCCIPCSEVVGGIKSITAAVRGINRG